MAAAYCFFSSVVPAPAPAGELVVPAALPPVELVVEPADAPLLGDVVDVLGEVLDAEDEPLLGEVLGAALDEELLLGEVLGEVLGDALEDDDPPLGEVLGEVLDEDELLPLGVLGVVMLPEAEPLAEPGRLVVSVVDDDEEPDVAPRSPGPGPRSQP